MFNKLKQFKDIRDQAKEMQNQLAKETVTVEKASGNIVLTMNGNLEITGLAIDPSLLDPNSQNKVQEGIKDAHAEALKKMQRVMATKMKEMGGLPDIPGLS